MTSSGPGPPFLRRLRPAAAAAAGPSLIVVGVLVSLRYVTLQGQLRGDDVLTLFLPNYCFLGKALAAGHIPLWNPYTLSGTPFAADPQSGWAYLPAMALFSALRCDLAMRALIALLPMIGGLGTYWLLRTERVSRGAATVGGLAMALSVAGSSLALSLPFSATMAWTPVVLAGASRALGAPAWPGRLAWVALAALAWGQLAAGYFSDGLVAGTLILLAFLAARSWSAVRAGVVGPWRAFGHSALTLAALPLVNLAYLLPRAQYLPRTTLGLGYGTLQKISEEMSGLPPRPIAVGPGADPTWALKLATSPGTYFGAVALVLAFAAWWGRRRALTAALTAAAALCYAASLRAVASALAPLMRRVPLGDFYLHVPARLRIGVLAAIPILAGLGMEAWMEARSGGRRLAMVAPGLAVWLVLPAGFGVDLSHMALVLAGAVGGGVALLAAARRPALVAAVPAVLFLELVANAQIGLATGPNASVPPGISGPWSSPPLQTAANNTQQNGATWVKGGEIERALSERWAGNVEGQQGRVVALGLSGWVRLRAMPMSSVSRFESVQGYNAVQLWRYWRLVRAASPPGALESGPLADYHLDMFEDPPPSLIGLLNVEWLEAPAPLPTGSPVVLPRLAREDGLRLFALARPAPRASVTGSFVVVGSFQRALEAVTDASFDSERIVILESDPGMEPTGATGTARTTVLGPQSVRVEATASARAMVMVRIPYDSGWRATVDGQPARIVPADAAMQAVPVPPGRHVVELRYEDPWVGWGVAGSAGALGVLLLPALWVRRRGWQAP